MKNIKKKKGLTIEYVMITMTIVVAFVVLIFTTMLFDSSKSGEYRHYVEKKQFLDDVGNDFINNKINNKKIDLNSKYSDNKFGCNLLVTGNSLTVSNGQVVVLYVSFTRENGKYVLETYQYGV